MLFRLNTIRAVVKDIPMDAVYADEESNLNIRKILPEFSKKHLIRLGKRYFYKYLLRDFNLGSLYSIFGLILFLFGVFFGMTQWISSSMQHKVASSGTVMLAALPTLVGIQFIIAFLQYDISSTPKEPLSTTLAESMDLSSTDMG